MPAVENELDTGMPPKKRSLVDEFASRVESGEPHEQVAADLHNSLQQDPQIDPVDQMAQDKMQKDAAIGKQIEGQEDQISGRSNGLEKGILGAASTMAGVNAQINGRSAKPFTEGYDKASAALDEPNKQALTNREFLKDRLTRTSEPLKTTQEATGLKSKLLGNEKQKRDNEIGAATKDATIQTANMQPAEMEAKLAGQKASLEHSTTQTNALKAAEEFKDQPVDPEIAAAAKKLGLPVPATNRDAEHPLYKDISNIVQHKLTMAEQRATKLELAGVNNASKKEIVARKTTATDDKSANTRLDAFGKEIEGSLASSRNGLGRINALEQSVGRAEQLTKNGQNLTPQQMYELAKAVDSAVSSGSSATVYGTSHILPRSLSGSVASIEQYLADKPVGAGQEEFVKSMLETLDREKKFAQSSHKDLVRRRAQSYGDLRDHPRYTDILKSQGENPDDYGPRGEYQPKPPSPSTSGTFPRTVRNAQTGHSAQVQNEAELKEAQSEGFN